MLNIMRLCLGTITRLFALVAAFLLENLALRQQLAVFKRRHPRTRLTFLDKLFWVAARQICSDWKQFLIVVLPDTVVQWHRSGFALYWHLISRFPGRTGRKRIAKEIRDLIFRMVAENATWGAPRIHGELLMLGFDVSERTISRWMRKAPRDPEPAKRWLAFVRNHRASRSHCGDGLLHRANDHLRCALLLLCHRPRPSAHSAFQHHAAPDEPVGCPAAKRSLPV